MKATTFYEAMAEAFVAEGVDVHFTLVGDANMHWATALSQKQGVRTIYVRHEHCACAMAMGYHSATGKVGIASVTCGPGFTQIMTALTCAARTGVPMIVFAGDTPITSRWNNQRIDYGPLAKVAGAHYIAAHSPSRMLDDVQEAFYVARYLQQPVVLGIPYDLQKLPLPKGYSYTTADKVIPDFGPLPPNPNDIDRLVKKLAAARRPVILAGRGVMKSGAETAVELLADRAGALLATTLPARGMFDHNPFSIGVSGGFASQVANECLAEADLVLAIGASLTFFTSESGRMFPNAFVAQLDEQPLGLRHGSKAADLYVRADARLGAEAILACLDAKKPTLSQVRTPALARRIAQLPADGMTVDIADGTLDPRAVVGVLDETIPKDWDIVSGSGHSSYFPTHMRGRKPSNFHVMREFGAIGNSLSLAIGVAVAKRSDKIVLIDGDGGTMMHIQELETIVRHGIKLLIIVFNDGAFGAEIHKLREEGLDDSGAMFGRPDFAAIGRGFGIRGATVTDVTEIRDLFDNYAAGSQPEIWDIHISDQVVSPRMRRQVKRLKKG